MIDLDEVIALLAAQSPYQDRQLAGIEEVAEMATPRHDAGRQTTTHLLLASAATAARETMIRSHLVGVLEMTSEGGGAIATATATPLTKSRRRRLRHQGVAVTESETARRIVGIVRKRPRGVREMITIADTGLTTSETRGGIVIAREHAGRRRNALARKGIVAMAIVIATMTGTGTAIMIGRVRAESLQDDQRRRGRSPCPTSTLRKYWSKEKLIGVRSNLSRSL